LGHCAPLSGAPNEELPAPVFPQVREDCIVGEACDWLRREEDDDLAVTLRTCLGASGEEQDAEVMIT
jgi:hypothetical protein